MSDNIGITVLTTNQTGKEVTINNAFSAYDAALTERLGIDLTNNVTLTSPQYRSAIYFDVTLTGVTKTLTLPAIKRMVVIRNLSTLPFSVAVGITNISLPAGQTGITFTDGTANGVSMTKIGSGLPAGGVGVAASATNTLTLSSNPADTETVTIGTQTYTFQTSFTAGAGHVKIGAAVIDSLTNLARCINQVGTGAGTLYDNTATPANTNVTATEASPMVVTAVATGSQYNTVATTETLANGAWTTTTLTGGKSKQFLGKTTDADFDVDWYDPPVSAGGGGGGGGGTTTELLYGGRVAPVAANFTLVNPGVGPNDLQATSTPDGFVLSALAAGGTDNVHQFIKSVPVGTNWTVDFGITADMPFRNFYSGGVILKDSVGGKFYGFSGHSGTALFIGRYTNATTFTSTLVSESYQWRIIWFRIVFDNTNYSFYLSHDGQSWYLLAQEAKTAFLAAVADKIGFFVNPASSLAPLVTAYLRCWHYKEH